MESSIKKTQSGFAMLFTVLIVSLILSIAISISNITLKQAVLSNLAKDSQIAFYQADAAVECGMYEDTALGLFPLGSTTATVPSSFMCGDTTMVLVVDPAVDARDYFIYEPFKPNPALPNFKIVFDKTQTASKYFKVQGYGYNIWDSTSPRQVERALEAKY